MRRSTIFWMIGGLALALVVLRLAVFAPRQDDQELIQVALKESLEASKEGRPGGVMDILSEKFRINGQRPGSRWDIAKFIRDSKPDLTVENRKAIVSGDRATIVSPVRIQANVLTREFDTTVEEVTLVFEREDSMRWLVIPSKQWRLTDVVLSENSIPAEFRGSMDGY